MTEPVVEIRHVRKRFGDVEVLHDINLTVARGEVVCLLGPSGAGKSTLLRCINHLERIDAGVIRIGGKPVGYRPDGDTLVELRDKEIARRRREIGMVFQSFNLFANMTALENIMFAPVRTQRASRQDAQDYAHALLARVGLEARGGSYPRQLSGGEQQRIAIARALAMKPRVLLFDEPTSALDPERVDEVLSVMRGLAREGMTMIVVTHEVGFAREAADTVAFMTDGRIGELSGPQDFFERPRSGRARDFVSKVLS